jgi:hypothetical protein
LGKISVSLYLSFLLLFCLLLPLYAEGKEAIEEESQSLLQEMAFEISLDGSSLTLDILSLEVDETLFAPQILVKSDILFTRDDMNERRNLYFLTETKESSSHSFITHLYDMIPSVLNALFSLDTDPYRLYYADEAPLSAKKEGESNHLGKRFVTTRKDNTISSLLLVTSIDDEYIYLSPLWAENELMQYMKLSSGPSSAISLLLPFNFNSLAVNALYELFPIWGVGKGECGVKVEFDFT